MWVPVLSWNASQLFWCIRRWPLHSSVWGSHACVIVSDITCHSNSLQMCFFSFASSLNSYWCIQLPTVHLHLEPRRWLKLDRFSSESDVLTLICLLYSSLYQKMATLSICLARNLGILSLLSFSQLFVRPCQTTILPFCISFSLGWSWSLSPV